MKIKLLFLLVLFSKILFSQVSGIVKDSLTQKPIPYVNIWLVNQNTGTTSDTNGRFHLPETASSAVLAFSSVGYKAKKANLQASCIVYLQSQMIDLPEFIITSSKEIKHLSVGQFQKSDIFSLFACGTAPWIVARYFPYSSQYNETPLIQSLKLLTRSQVKNASFNIRFYEVNEDGSPGNFLYDRNILGVVKKGKSLTFVDLSPYNICIPNKGIFIAVEWLLTEENKYEYTYTMPGSKKRNKGIRYEPAFGSIPCNTNNNSWIYSQGIWKNAWWKNKNRKTGTMENYSQLAVELLLTN